MKKDDKNKPALTINTAIGTFRSAPAATIERERLKKHPDYCECIRCEVEPGVPFGWIKRVPGRPKRCPNCNSPKWDSAPRWKWHGGEKAVSK